MGKYLTADQFLLTTLVVKIAVVAALATLLVRFRRFRQILIFERRDWPDRLLFILSFGIPISLGVISRLLLKYNAADLTLEGPLVAGLIAGPYSGALVGALGGIPAVIAGEWIALPFAVGCGFAGGGLRELCPKDAIWKFSPFVFTGLHRHAWTAVRSFKVDWQVLLLASPIGLELLRQALGYRFGDDHLFFLGKLDDDPLKAASPVLTGVVLIATVLSVATPIKIWNTARIEHRVQEQEKLLLAAKIEALANQINPHFLFNTLTSISSLIRSNPETARVLIGKLSGLLRRLLRSHEHFVSLREELESMDQYLDIEVVRFGPRLQVVKEIESTTLDVIVPCMILQPLVENSIKHGVSRKIGGGRIVIRSQRQNGATLIEITDDGPGMSMNDLEEAIGRGIGVSNVDERLRVIYGDNHGLKLSSVAGVGTSVRMEIPELVISERITA